MAHTTPQEQGSSGMVAGGAKVGHLLQVGMRGGLTHYLTPRAWGRQNRWTDQLVHKLLFHSVAPTLCLMENMLGIQVCM